MSKQTTPRGLLGRLFGNRQAGSHSQRSSQRGEDRKVLVHAAENFHSLCVEDVMVPRAEIIAVADDLSLDKLTQSFIDAGHSRLPTYKDTLDEPTGFVHVKDLVGLVGPFINPQITDHPEKSYADQKIIHKIKRPVLFVPPSMAADALLKKMQASRVHMAIVVDEYGGTDGLVTLEDIIEEIVGDIEDEHDDGEPEIRTLKDKTGQTYWEADARADIEDFEALFGRDIATPKQDEEVDTLGGLVFSLAGRIPERGEIIRTSIGLEFEILDADPRRIKRVRLRQSASDAAADTPKLENK